MSEYIFGFSYCPIPGNLKYKEIDETEHCWFDTDDEAIKEARLLYPDTLLYVERVERTEIWREAYL